MPIDTVPPANTTARLVTIKIAITRALPLVESVAHLLATAHLDVGLKQEKELLKLRK